MELYEQKVPSIEPSFDRPLELYDVRDSLKAKKPMETHPAKNLYVNDGQSLALNVASGKKHICTSEELLAVDTFLEYVMCNVAKNLEENSDRPIISNGQVYSLNDTNIIPTFPTTKLRKKVQFASPLVAIEFENSDEELTQDTLILGSDSEDFFLDEFPDSDYWHCKKQKLDLFTCDDRDAFDGNGASKYHNAMCEEAGSDKLQRADAKKLPDFEAGEKDGEIMLSSVFSDQSESFNSPGLRKQNNCLEICNSYPANRENSDIYNRDRNSGCELKLGLKQNDEDRLVPTKMDTIVENKETNNANCDSRLQTMKRDFDALFKKKQQQCIDNIKSTKHSRTPDSSLSKEVTMLIKNEDMNDESSDWYMKTINSKFKDRESYELKPIQCWCEEEGIFCIL